MDVFTVEEMMRGSRASSKQAQVTGNEMRQLRSTSKTIFMQQLEAPTKSSDFNNAPKPLIEGVSYPATPGWNIERPFLTGQVFHQDSRTVLGGRVVSPDSFSMSDFNKAIGIFAPSVQELLLIDDLLFTMVGIEGKYISFKRGKSKDTTLSFQVDPSMDLSLQELAKRIVPLCESYIIVSQFTESRSHFKYGLVNHALAAALRAILQDYHALVAQLEHQFRLSRLALQGLWFFCQPMMGAMQVLASVVQKASGGLFSGAAILNLLENQAAAIAGDSAARSLLQKLSQFASAPYLGILERWVYEGVIDDPYGEFFIDENKALQKESLSQDYNATYWQQRYSLKHELPGFLSSAAETILTTGKYLNAMRECGHSVKIPFPDTAKESSSGTRHYLERINVAYNFASAELLNLIVQKFDLMGRLRSVKHYFLVDQGDLIVHFMDIAKDELAKRPSTISVEKLQSLLDVALRTSIAASDPYYEDLFCNVEKVTLLKQLENLQKMGVGGTTDTVLQLEKFGESSSSSELSSSQAPSAVITGLETFTLNYKVQWPLSLVISRKALMKYQLIFRLLFHCKHVERQLCGTWQVHQATRGVRFIGTPMPRSYVLCQRMLHFTQTFVHYLTFEVIEPHWHVMYTKLQTVKSIDEVIAQHDFFLDKCLKECALLWPQIFKKVEKLKTICLQYATATQWLIPSMSSPDPVSNDLIALKLLDSEKLTDERTSRNRHDRDQSTKSFNAADEATFRTTIGKIEEEYDKELKKLVLLLTNGSQTDPYLAHLAHGLQGMQDVQAGNL